MVVFKGPVVPKRLSIYLIFLILSVSAFWLLLVLVITSSERRRCRLLVGLCDFSGELCRVYGELFVLSGNIWDICWAVWGLFKVFLDSPGLSLGLQEVCMHGKHMVCSCQCKKP